MKDKSTKVTGKVTFIMEEESCLTTKASIKDFLFQVRSMGKDFNSSIMETVSKVSIYKTNFTVGEDISGTTTPSIKDSSKKDI